MKAHISVIATLSVLIDIEPLLFDTSINTQSMQFLDRAEQHNSTYCSPEIDYQYAEALCTEESPSVTIKRAVRRREESGTPCTDEAPTGSSICSLRSMNSMA